MAWCFRYGLMVWRRRVGMILGGVMLLQDRCPASRWNPIRSKHRLWKASAGNRGRIRHADVGARGIV